MSDDNIKNLPSQQDIEKDISNYLSKKYGENVVLSIESLDIPKGQSFGLVGNNGA